MINRARDIAKMMGFDSIDTILEAIGRGDLILFKLDDGQQMEASEWLHQQMTAVEKDNERLSATLHDIADGIELAMELKRYPADTDICDMDLPHGWPSYCERELLE
jgi:hypothetical protein